MIKINNNDLHPQTPSFKAKYDEAVFKILKDAMKPSLDMMAWSPKLIEEEKPSLSNFKAMTYYSYGLAANPSYILKNYDIRCDIKADSSKFEEATKRARTRLDSIRNKKILSVSLLVISIILFMLIWS